MFFTYDKEKDEANLKNHKISLDEARAFWDDPNMIVTKVWRNDERRSVGLARYAGRCWVVVFKLEGDEIRLISARKATKRESASYDKANR